MRRTRLVLLALAAASAGVAGLATPANACMGPVCEAICAVQANPAVQKLPGLDNCIVK